MLDEIEISLNILFKFLGERLFFFVGIVKLVECIFRVVGNYFVIIEGEFVIEGS